MRAKSLCVLVLLATPSLAVSQAENPRPEIGFRAALSRVTEKSDFGSQTYTTLMGPTSAFLSPGGVHFTFFVSPKVALEPQFGLSRISSDDDTFSIMYLAAQGNFFLGPDANKSPYLFGQIATLREDEGDSDSQNAFGGGVGFRRVHRESIAMRYELRYRRWSASDDITINELAFVVGVGAVIRK